jgi:hypothetical protein
MLGDERRLQALDQASEPLEMRVKPVGAAEPVHGVLWTRDLRPAVCGSRHHPVMS